MSGCQREKNNNICAACKAAVVAVIIFIAVISLGAGYTHKVMLPDTGLYENYDFSSRILAVMPQNAVVTIRGESFTDSGYEWQKITYNNITGYVLASDLFQSKTIQDYSVTKAKARSSKMGLDIPLYGSNDASAEAILDIHDGAGINVMVSEVDYGEFYMVEYEGTEYFALKKNISFSLSYNESLALIIGGSALFAAAVAAVAVSAVKRKKNK